MKTFHYITVDTNEDEQACAIQLAVEEAVNLKLIQVRVYEFFYRRYKVVLVNKYLPPESVSRIVEEVTALLNKKFN